jgi:hypothetical protein
MGFSLAGFGAGLAESVYERIEEERKFSNLALQGRIERASVLKMQQDKEAKAIEEELRQRRDRLVELGVTDQTLQKAYLTSPLAYETLEKAQKSGLNVDPAKLITVNQDKLFTGTSDELIRKATAAQDEVAPATIATGEGRSWLSPSAGQMQRRFEQTAGARGMTLQDVARAESAARPKMPEPAATINFGLLKKEDTSTIENRQGILDRKAADAIAADPNSPEAKAAKKAADDYRAASASVIPPKEDKTTWKQRLERFETAYADAADKFGPDSKEAVAAKNRVDAYRATTSNLTEDQLDHAKKLSRAQAIVFDKTLTNVTEQDRKWAEGYLREYDAYKKRQEAAGKSDEKIPSPNSLISIGRTAGANAVRATFGAGALGKQLSFITNADGSTSMQYSGDKPDVQKQLIRREQEGIVASMRPYMTSDGKVADKKVEVALQSFGITLDANRRPVLIEAPAPAEPRQAPALPSRTPTAAPAASAAPARSTRPATPTQVADEFANIGAPAGGAAAPRTQQRPAKPASVPGAPVGHSVGDYVEGKGYAVYNKQGKLIGYATE